MSHFENVVYGGGLSGSGSGVDLDVGAFTITTSNALTATLTHLADDSATGTWSYSGTFTVRSDGGPTLTLGTPILSAGLSLVDPLVSSLAPRASDTFEVQLDTTSTGTRVAKIGFSNNDSDENPFNSSITGTVNASTPALPDLYINTLSGLPSSITAGQSGTFFYSIGNAGSVTAPSSITGVYLATDYDVIRSGDRPLAFDVVPAIAANTQPSLRSVGFTLPNDVTPGTYYVYAVADNAGQVQEGNDGNNVFWGSAIIVIESPPPPPPPPAEITVLGNGVNIADGDTTPSSTDFTDFGSASQDGAAIVRTFTVQNNGGSTLTLGTPTLPAGFSLVDPLASSLAPGASDTFQVQLDISSTGTKSGQISFSNNDSDENPFNFSITGTVNASPSLFTEDSDIVTFVEAAVIAHALGGDDLVTGSSDSDSIYGDSGADTLIGAGGSDYLDGGTGNDTLSGGPGNDWLSGGDGNDTLTGGPGNDLLDGGASIDTASYADATSGVTVNLLLAGAQAVGGGEGSDTLTGIENLTGSAFNDSLTGNNGVNTLSGGTGNDTLVGNNSNDTLIGGEGNDYVDGGSNHDTMAGGPGNDLYVVNTGQDIVNEFPGEGTNDAVSTFISMTIPANVESLTQLGMGNNFVIGNSLDNLIVGNVGNNALAGGPGNDNIRGGPGDDTLSGNTGTDTANYADATGGVTVNLTLTGPQVIGGGRGADTLASFENIIGSPFNDTLTGDGGQNVLTGRDGDDTLLGNGGNDTLDGGNGNDTMQGGMGNDIYFVNADGDVVTENADEGTDLVNSSISYSLPTNVENLMLTGVGNLSGIGNTLDNVLTGNSANNELAGGAGNDTLQGGLGSDTLSGNAGNDIFRYTASNEGGDTVTDFTLGADKFNFVSANFGALAPGQLLAGNFALDAPTDSDDLFVFLTGSKTLTFDPDGNGIGAALTIAALSNGVTLSNTDITIVAA